MQGGIGSNGIPPHQLVRLAADGTAGNQLQQVDSSQSFKTFAGVKQTTAPIFVDMLTSASIKGQQKKLAAASKAQKIKIGLHKKAISLATQGGPSQQQQTQPSHHHSISLAQVPQPTHTSQPSQNLQPGIMMSNGGDGNVIKHSNSRKKTAMNQKQGGQKISNQMAQIHEYKSNNNNNIIVMNYGGDVQIFPKIDNFIIGNNGNTPDKGGDTRQRTPSSGDLTKKQQQMMIDQTHLMQMKNYQRIINEASANMQQPRVKNHDSRTEIKNQDTPGMKASFDSGLNGGNRPPLGQGSCLSQSTTGHPSQRISIISSSIGEDSVTDNKNAHLINSANVVSRAEVHQVAQSAAIKASTQHVVTIKNTQNKFQKGGPTLKLLQQEPQSPMGVIKDQDSVLQSSPPNQKQQIFSSGGSNPKAHLNKKSLINHHQRTFSDIPQATQALIHARQYNNEQHGADNAGSDSNRMMYDGYEDAKSASQTRDGDKKNHRKIVKNMQSIDSNHTQTKNSSTLIGAMQNATISTSSRQGTQKTIGGGHSHHMTEERDALMQLLHKAASTHHKPSPSLPQGTNEMKHIYQGILREQIQKTKHALKLTQTQFGQGNSRKVVQSGKLNGGANTQSFRISQQSAQTSTNAGVSQSQGAVLMMTAAAAAAATGLNKLTPKLYLSKTKKHTKQPSINNSSQGARASTNMTKLSNPTMNSQMVYINEGRLQKLVASGNSRATEASSNGQKGVYTTGAAFANHEVNFQGALGDIMARTSTKAAMMSIDSHAHQSHAAQTSVQESRMSGASHKRSVSDGNTIFQSMLSGRGGGSNAQNPLASNFDNSSIQYPNGGGQIYKSTNVGSGKKSSSNKLQFMQNQGASTQVNQMVNGGLLPNQHELMKSTFQRDSSMSKITTAPYDQVMQVAHQDAHHHNQQHSIIERPHSGARPSLNTYAIINHNSSTHRSQQSQNTKIGSHRHIIESSGPGDHVSQSKRHSAHSKGQHHRHLSHQITIETHKERGDRGERGESLGGQSNTNMSLPRPPVKVTKANSNLLSKKDGGRRSSSKGAGAEIVIEDQGTPKGHHNITIATPLSQTRGSNQQEQIVFDMSGVRKQGKDGNGKDKLLSILNKKDSKKGSGRRSIEKNEASKHNENDFEKQERFDTHESAISDPNLSPRSRKNAKLSRLIRLAFQKTSNAPATNSDFYKIGKVMGKGAFGKVNLAIHRLSGKFVALKSINKTFLNEEASKRKVMQEFNILQRTRHRNIVRLYESFETPQHIVFVMEVCGAGDLLTYVRRRRKLKEDVGKHLFKQIVEGLRYCHSRGILHRDIKLDNILLTSEGDIKICDFGVSKLVKLGETMKEQCGTPAYIAPEVFEGNGYQGFASDVWSAGVVLYAMLYGTVPFKASNMTELQRQICKGQTTYKDEISVEAISLLQGILEKDPSQRLSIAQILGHPWMQNIQKSIQVFTDQEKDKVNQEFAYYNMKGDQNDPGEVVHTDPFAEQMSLNSTQNSLVKNVSTKSVILAPFNSTRTHIDEDFHLHESIQDMMIDKRVIKFAAKVKEIDRQYEANNNAELDNGVYHQEDEEEKEQPNGPPASAHKLPPQQQQLRQDDESLQKEIEAGQKQKNQSEWQKIERMMIKKQRNEDEQQESKVHQMMKSSNANVNLVIDYGVVAEIERNGFPKQYITISLNNDELNYVTAYYFLLCTQKEY